MSDLLDDIDVPSPTESFLEDVLREFDPNGDFDINPSPSIFVPNSNNASLEGFSPEFNANSTSQDLSAGIPQAAAFPLEMQSPSFPECLTIIAQPYCSSKARYRKDYKPPSKRREPLTNTNPDSNYKGPAVSILFTYLDVTKEYYIGVSLTTLVHEKTNCRYLHPYELESIDYDNRNDRSNNIVWFPIGDEDRNGIKSFPDLRVVRKTEDELESYGNLRPFYGYNSNLLNNVKLSKRQIVREFNLKKAQLAFFIGQKTNTNDKFPTIIDANISTFSDDIILVPDQETVEDNASTESATKSDPPDCRMYKYAPRYGYTEGNDMMLIFFTKKLEVNKYGKLQVTFESDIPNIEWSAKINEADIEVKDQMVSFRTPNFPFSIDARTVVKIILQQRDRILEPLEYSYIDKSQCLTCQANAMNIPNPFTRNNSNKRTKPSQNTSDDELDAIVPVAESNPVLRQSKSEPESNSSNSTSRLSINTSQSNPEEDLILKRLHESIVLLFTNNDFKPLLRTCRPFVRKRPELLHGAISNNYSDLVSKFVSVAGVELLPQKNQLGETVLLHAARLNHVNIIKALLEREKSDKLLEDTNDKGQNIFHILALNTNSDEIIDLLINHLFQKSINIQETFDYVDKDNHTPLQLAILNNNLPATRYLVKYFNTNVCETPNHIGENLIHLAVRYGDLTMLKYLLDEGQLIKQGNETSLVMTPIELARSMKRDDMVEYLKEVYPQPEIDEEENSNSD